ERVLERELEVRKEPDLVEELRSLETGQLVAHLVLWHVGNGEQQGQGYILADDGSSLEQAFTLGGQAVDARGQDGLDGGGHLQLLNWSSKPVGAALTGQGARLNKGPHALLEEEGIGLRSPDQKLLERNEGRVTPKQRIEQLIRIFGRQGVKAELAVIGLAAPFVAVLRTVVDKK